MRVLCLRFYRDVESSWGEAFLRWSSQVTVRPPHFIFVEISATSHLFGGEASVLSKALELARELAQGPVQIAISDSPPGAQVMSLHAEPQVVEAKCEKAALGAQGLKTLADLEGLTPWPKPEQVQKVVEFFQVLGLSTLSDVQRFPLESLRERWGSLGTLLWKRLHGQESQVISPLLAREPFYGYVFYENSPTCVMALQESLHESLRQLFARLHGLGRFARALEVILHCEYSQVRHRVMIEPVSPSRHLELFEDLFYKKVEKIDFENPFKEAEIMVHDVVERVEQLDLFEPRETSRDRWQRLMSFASMMGIKLGFLQRRPGLFPEHTVGFRQAELEDLSVDDVIETEAHGVRRKPAYAKALQNSPRPTLLLKEPKLLSNDEMQEWRWLTPIPLERLVGEWWQNEETPVRDYYVALTGRGELWWVFKDRVKGNFHLQGAFD